MGIKVGARSKNPPVGNEEAQIVRVIPKKNCGLPYFNSFMIAAAALSGQWIDTAQDGTSLVEFTMNSVNGTTVRMQVTDDLGNAFVTNSSIVITNATGSGVVNQSSGNLQSFAAIVNARYWRLQITNGATAQNVVITYSISGNGMTVQGTYPNSFTAAFPGLVGVAVESGTASGDAASAQYVSTMGNAGSAGPLAVAQHVYAGSPAAGNNAVGVRTPTTFLSALCQNGITVVFAPGTAKKARLMKYKIEVGEDVTISGGPTGIMLDWVWGSSISSANQLVIGVANGPFGASTWGLSHRFVAPASVLATSGSLWDSGWIDLGNGQLPQFTQQPWALAISVPQPITTAINPTWTIASNQWEAATIGFKSVGNLGGARVRAITQAAGVASAVTVGISPKTGNTLIIGVRTTNIAAGVPTVAITDASGNSTPYTALTAVNNASDVGPTNGSSLQLFYTIGIASSWNGAALTATTSVHAATLTEIIVVEVEGIVAVGGTGQVSATGNSTAPAAGNYAPAEAGDYIANFFASGANIATGTVTPGILRSFQNSASGTLAFTDNFANGTLSTGGINVIAIGTEE